MKYNRVSRMNYAHIHYFGTCICGSNELNASKNKI